MADTCERCDEPLGDKNGRKPGLCVDCTAEDFGGYCEECGEACELVYELDGLCRKCATSELENIVDDEPEDTGDGEPDEDAYITEDHERFFQYGKLVLSVDDGDEWAHAVRDHMEDEKFWPDVWFISDHGNAHLIDMFDALAEADERTGKL